MTTIQFVWVINDFELHRELRLKRKMESYTFGDLKIFFSRAVLSPITIKGYF